MDYRTIFGRPFEDWKRDAKEFADNIRGMASEGMHEQGGPEWHCNFKFDDRGGPFTDFWFPRTNVYEDREGRLVLSFLLPGFEESGISVSFRGDRLVLRARLSEAQRQQGDLKYIRKAFQLRDIDWREYPVPAERWDQAATKAVFRNGILTVTVPSKGDSGDEGAVKIEIVKEGD